MGSQVGGTGGQAWLVARVAFEQDGGKPEGALGALEVCLREEMAGSWGACRLQS